MQKAKKQKAEVFWTCLAAPPGKRQAGFQKMEKREEVKGGLFCGVSPKVGGGQSQ